MKKTSYKKKSALKRKKKVEKNLPVVPIVSPPTLEEEKKKFLFHWNNLSWSAKHYVKVAQDFFVENKCSTILRRVQGEMYSLQPDLPITKLMFYFISSPMILHMREENKFVEKEHILILNRCAYIVKILGKKMLDPNIKESIRFKWPNLEGELSFSEILFFWFVFQYDIGDYFLQVGKQVFEHYSQEKQIRTTSHKAKFVRS
jgi:hypothetical protein